MSTSNLSFTPDIRESINLVTLAKIENLIQTSPSIYRIVNFLNRALEAEQNLNETTSRFAKIAKLIRDEMNKNPHTNSLDKTIFIKRIFNSQHVEENQYKFTQPASLTSYQDHIHFLVNQLSETIVRPQQKILLSQLSN